MENFTHFVISQNKLDFVISQIRICDITKIEFVISQNERDFVISQIRIFDIIKSNL